MSSATAPALGAAGCAAQRPRDALDQPRRAAAALLGDRQLSAAKATILAAAEAGVPMVRRADHLGQARQRPPGRRCRRRGAALAPPRRRREAARGRATRCSPIPPTARPRRRLVGEARGGARGARRGGAAGALRGRAATRRDTGAVRGRPADERARRGAPSALRRPVRGRLPAAPGRPGRGCSPTRAAGVAPGAGCRPTRCGVLDVGCAWGYGSAAIAAPGPAGAGGGRAWSATPSCSSRRASDSRG